MKTFLNALLLCLVMVPATLMAQSTVSGTVTDKANAMPLPGVNVLVKGTSRGASTDFDGNYTLEVNQGEIIVISYVGYKTQEITYTGQSTIDVVLEEDVVMSEEEIIIVDCADDDVHAEDDPVVEDDEVTKSVKSIVARNDSKDPVMDDFDVIDV